MLFEEYAIDLFKLEKEAIVVSLPSSYSDEPNDGSVMFEVGLYANAKIGMVYVDGDLLPRRAEFLVDGTDVYFDEVISMAPGSNWSFESIEFDAYRDDLLDTAKKIWRRQYSSMRQLAILLPKRVVLFVLVKRDKEEAFGVKLSFLFHWEDSAAHCSIEAADLVLEEEQGYKFLLKPLQVK